LDALRNAGVGKKDLFTDKISGAKQVRPGLDACLRHLVSGDTLLVWRLDRFGRSLRHLIDLVVRRALDRVRHLALGGTAMSVDQRISAVAGDATEPTLLFIFLGRIHSRAGREFEQVLAVLVRPPAVTEFISSSERWLSLADPANAINTRDVWKNHFALWADNAEATALAAARRHFGPIAADVLHRRRAELGHDRDRLQDWLESRAREIIADRGQLAVQADLFAGARTFSFASPSPRLADSPPPSPAPWARLADPLERLAGFASDNSQPVALRHEAQTVLTLFKKRRDDLDARDAVRDPEVTTLGMLMIVPKTLGSYTLHKVPL
jgi:hypothetical protein